jgi:hypothetical protein
MLTVGATPTPFAGEKLSLNLFENSAGITEPTSEAEELDCLILDKDFDQSAALESTVTSPKSKRKRQHRGKMPRCFEGSGVLPQAGETEWDPSKLLYHTGKWPIEEERFANRLVLEFEAGVLEDCRDGVTLRSYLAKTLRCAPMRVSKKLAGKCIGSKVFCRQHVDRKAFLHKIATGELNIPSLQKRINPKSISGDRRPNKQQWGSTPDLTDDESSSGSSSCFEDYESDENNPRKQAKSNNSSEGRDGTFPPSQARAGSEAVAAPTDMYTCPMLPEFESNIDEYGADLYLPDVSTLTGEGCQHVVDLGYDEWKDALSYFKESEYVTAL